MLKVLVILSVVGIPQLRGFAQIKDTYGTSQALLDKLLTRLRDSKVEPFDSTEISPHRAIKNDTISPGLWRGRYFNEDFSLRVTRTFPDVEGNFERVLTSIEDEDVARGPIKGVREGSICTIVFKYHTELYYMVGYTHTIKVGNNAPLTVYSGLMCPVVSRGNDQDTFFLYKE